MNVDSAVVESTVLVELLRLVLTVLQGKQWQREVEDTNQTVIGVSLYLAELLHLSIYLSVHLLATRSTSAGPQKINKVGKRS